MKNSVLVVLLLLGCGGKSAPSDGLHDVTAIDRGGETGRKSPDGSGDAAYDVSALDAFEVVIPEIVPCTFPTDVTDCSAQPFALVYHNCYYLNEEYGVPRWSSLMACFGDPDVLCGAYGCNGQPGGLHTSLTYYECACFPGNPGYPLSPDDHKIWCWDKKGIDPTDNKICPAPLGLSKTWSGHLNYCSKIEDSPEACMAYLKSLPDPTLAWRHCYTTLCKPK